MSATSAYGAAARPDAPEFQARQAALVRDTLAYLGMEGRKFAYLEELATTVAIESARRDPVHACGKTALLSNRAYKISLLEFIQRYPQNMPRERRCEMKAWLLQLKYMEQRDENQALQALLASVQTELAQFQATQ